MFHQKSYLGSKPHSNFLRILFIIIPIVVVAGIAIPAIVIIQRNTNIRMIQKSLIQYWESGDYKVVFDLSNQILKIKPLDYFALMMHGFSSYHIALAQINNEDMLASIDTCIWSLRKALLVKENAANSSTIRYMLGKAYYYKGESFADLAIKFLQEVQNTSMELMQDIPEYLGVLYARLHDYRRSVDAFAQALKQPEKPSDLLLLSAARSYIELGEPEQAKAYLVRCAETSNDVNSIITARLLLATILKSTGDRAGAEAQLTAVIDLNIENAEAHYQLGELYAVRDSAKARTEWYRALQIDPTHKQARSRLGI
ncbi:MAG: tetratricopeptide repeat protein [Spirochaetaceae bacterium]|jgi:tetratricopeptide (TPR) repeat protein|nr:tetratricopeptide repeat protein [Spirochaetaceae bacterium]